MKRDAKVALIQHGPSLSPFALSLGAKARHVDRLFVEDTVLYHKGRQVDSAILDLYDIVHDETGFNTQASQLNNISNSPSLPMIDLPRHVASTRERKSRAELMMDNRKMSFIDVPTPHRMMYQSTGDSMSDIARIKESLYYPFTARPINGTSVAHKKVSPTRTIHSDDDLHAFLTQKNRSVLLEEYLPGITSWVLIVPGLRGALTYTAIPVGKSVDGSFKALNLNEPLKTRLLEAALETAEALFIERMVLASYRLTHMGEVVLLKVDPFPSELEAAQFIASLSASGISYDELTENVFDQVGV